MEKLSWLRIVDVSRNNIGGTIPSAIARWTSLMGISVAFNMFSGTLPSSMSTLTRLSSFDFRDNFFSGPLPNFNVPLQDWYAETASAIIL